MLNKFDSSRSIVSTVALLSAISSFLLNILCTIFLYIKELICGNMFPMTLITILFLSIILFYFSSLEDMDDEKDQDWDDENLDYES